MISTKYSHKQKSQTATDIINVNILYFHSDDDVKPRCHIVNNPRDNNSLWGNHSAKKYIIIFISKWAHCNHLIHPFIHPPIHPIDIIIAILTFQYMSKGLNQHPTLSSTLTFPFSSSSSSFR